MDGHITKLPEEYDATPTNADTICDVICRWAELQPDAPAFISENKAPLTYGALAELIRDFRQTINESGFGRGDRFAIVHPGGADMAAALFGIVGCATAVPLNPRNTAKEFQDQLHDRRVQAVIIQKNLQSPVRDVAKQLDLPVFDLVTDDEGLTGMVRLLAPLHQKPVRPEPSGADDIAYVLATSGTTSSGRIVPLRHRHLMARSQVSADLFGLTPDDRCINLNPLNYAQSRVAMVLASGGSIIFMPHFNVETFFNYLTELKPTWFQGSFTFHQAIRDHAQHHAKEIQESKIRFIRTSSGRLEPHITKDLERIFDVPVIEAYASSETGRIAGNPQPPGIRKPGTVGLPTGCEVLILNENGTPSETLERGEVTVRGHGVIDGYENNPEANAAAFIAGWYRTGDQGFLDEDGYLTLTGRLKEMINRGGEKINPVEVDSALTAHPDIAEAAAFAIPHPRLGEIVGAAIVPLPSRIPDKQELMRFLADRLNAYKIPRSYHVVEEIPRGPTGKILRTRLTDKFNKRGK
jgi:oxalate---CoA ligase